MAEIDARLGADWLLDLVPDERRIVNRYPDHPRWAAKLDEANERAVARHEDGGRFDEREIWRLMARPSLFALRGANRRHYILDGIAMGVGIARRFAIAGPILDAGCHLGVTASVLARLLPNAVVGIDPIGATIDAAQALNAGRQATGGRRTAINIFGSPPAPDAHRAGMTCRVRRATVGGTRTYWEAPRSVS